jgi:hypothetical protein
VRATLAPTGEIPQSSPTIGKDGRTYNTAALKKPKQRTPPQPAAPAPVIHAAKATAR